MKKFLPIIIFAVALVFFVGIALVMRGRSSSSDVTDENVAEIPFAQRPFTSLTPKSDGHFLALRISKITVPGAEMLDYELIYKNGDGVTQGVPGSITLDGNEITRELLLGSESSGKFRYDEGVEEGTITLRFRDAGGKLLGKLATDFHLQTNTDTLTSLDGKFSFKLTKTQSKTFFVTMNTFGVAATLSGTPKAGPYGVFASDATMYSGSVDLEGSVSLIDGTNVTGVDAGSQTTIGVFVSQ